MTKFNTTDHTSKWYKFVTFMCFRYKCTMPYTHSRTELYRKGQWLHDNIGEYRKAWRSHRTLYLLDNKENVEIYYFKNKKDRLHFLLRWS